MIQRLGYMHISVRRHSAVLGAEKSDAVYPVMSKYRKGHYYSSSESLPRFSH